MFGEFAKVFEWQVWRLGVVYLHSAARAPAISPARHPQKSSQHVRTCSTGDGAISSKNRKIVPYHEANPGDGDRKRAPFLVLGWAP